MELQQIKQRFGIIGTYPGLDRAIDIARQVAPTDLSVLISGESGTGKELVARALYHHSERKDRPFLAVNCAAISETSRLPQDILEEAARRLGITALLVLGSEYGEGTLESWRRAADTESETGPARRSVLRVEGEPLVLAGGAAFFLLLGALD